MPEITICTTINTTDASRETIAYLTERWSEANPTTGAIATEAIKRVIQDHVQALIEEWDVHLARSFGDAIEEAVEEIEQAETPPVSVQMARLRPALGGTR